LSALTCGTHFTWGEPKASNGVRGVQGGDGGSNERGGARVKKHSTVGGDLIGVIGFKNGAL